METLTINIPEHVEVKTVKAVLKALGVSFGEKTKNGASKHAKKEQPYDPEYVAMIQKSRQEVKDGKIHRIDLDEFWK